MKKARTSMPVALEHLVPVRDGLNVDTPVLPELRILRQRSPRQSTLVSILIKTTDRDLAVHRAGGLSTRQPGGTESE